MKKTLPIILILFVISLQAQTTESYHDTLNPKRLRTALISAGGFYVASMTVLYFAWYKGYKGTGFHWADDASEWMLKDKMGHFTTTYQVGNYGYWSLRHAGVSEKKAIWLGGTWGLLYMTSVEVFDGFSQEWGASPSDLLANTLGAGLFLTQQALWHEQRIRPKFSYHPTKYAQYRPDLLGENYWQRIIKDYNGETNWLSINIASFIKRDNRFPKWLCVSVGYGAKGMLGGTFNPPTYNGHALPVFDRTAQYYFSVDVDWTQIPTHSRVVRWIFKALSFVKIPAPALEYNRKDGIIFHPLFF